MVTAVREGPDPAAGSDERLRRFARSRRFLLGRPRTLTFVPDPDRLLFLRSLAADSPVTALWSLDISTGAERLLADPRELLAGEPEVVPAAELRRRERMRETARGIVAYSADDRGARAAFMLSGRLFSCDLRAGITTEVPAAGPVVDPRLRPDGTAVAYLAGRALRVCGLDGQVLLELSDPDPEVSIGAAEFGAAEEMGRHHGYWWSPDGRQLLAARVSERDVASWWLGDPSDAAAEPARQRYPFAGTANPQVALLLASLDGQITEVELPSAELPYLLAARWDPAGLLLVLHTRDHGRSEIRAVDPGTGQTRLLHADTDPDWLELTPGTPRYLPDGRLLHAAHSQDTHRLVIGGQPVTPPGLQVLSVAGTAGDAVIFCATPEPTERHVYSLDHASGEVTRLTNEPGLHTAEAGGALLAISSETLDSDGITVRVRRGGQPVASVGSLPQAAFAPGVTLLAAGERELRTAVVLPRDEVRPPGPLPVVMAPYGGPSQQVLRARRLFYEPQWLADQGFAVIVADGRGSPARGPAWERAFRFDVATAALDDQVAALEHVVGQYPGELDAGRVGIRGWSFGGYLSALAVLRRPDVFAAAIAGAPVSEWRWYDSVATERYLGHPAEHPEAYDASSLLPLAAGLTRPLLLVHGLTDDNVHPRHSLLLSRELTAAGRDHGLLLLPGVTHITWQPEIIEQLLGVHARFFRRWLAPGAQRSG
ncbi:MAG TPA: prolyl oligopeptidase family serine peptidase [Streptosporangiaceae bacterium]|nr:prolyl oligopeptidase family serine peptidase [Streptosporangiaceae bacterium]